MDKVVVTDLPERALSQDLAQLKLLWVTLLRPLLHMVSDAELFEGNIVLKSHTKTVFPSVFTLCNRDCTR